ncbi:MAG: glycosyltransferase family 2 protein [Acidobacteria bacterium]|nr:glycosyltransferase family 2 protein [Acidobacteriota bacterium]
MKPIENSSALVVAIVTWNSAGEIRECLGSLRDCGLERRTWIADNCSIDGTVDVVRREFSEASVIENESNLGFAAACNRIAANTSGEFILFLNPDTLVNSNALEAALGEMRSNRDIGLLSVSVVDDQGEQQKICYRFPTLGYTLLDALGLYRFLNPESRADRLLGDFFDHRESRDVDWVYGAFMLVRREALEKSGGVPEDYFLFAEDTDLCFAVSNAGYRVRYLTGASIVHKGNRSAGQMPSEWRIGRTVMSKYAFCFKNFGYLRTRLIQSADLVGNLADALRSRLRPGTRPSQTERLIYRRAIWRSIRLSRTRLRAELHRRPETDPANRT